MGSEEKVFVSPGVLSPQLLLGGEELDAVLQLEEGLLLGLVVHALVLLKVLPAAKQTTGHVTRWPSRGTRLTRGVAGPDCAGSTEDDLEGLLI